MSLSGVAVGACFDAKGRVGDKSPPSLTGDLLAICTGVATAFYAAAQAAYFPKESQVP
jgi:hypothetical protein